MCPLGTERVGPLSAPTIGLQVWNISGTVWWDAESDGMTDETPLAGLGGIRIELRDENGNTRFDCGLRILDFADPFAEQRGRAEPCRGGDEGEPMMQPRVQPLDQAGARYQIGPDGGDRVMFSEAVRPFHPRPTENRSPTGTTPKKEDRLSNADRSLLFIFGEGIATPHKIILTVETMGNHTGARGGADVV